MESGYGSVARTERFIENISNRKDAKETQRTQREINLFSH